MRVRSAASAVLCGVALLIPALAAPGAAVTGARPTFHTTNLHLQPLHLRARHNRTVSSFNWAGYAVGKPGAPVTAVRAQFVQPAFGLTPPGFAAVWTGIGGYGTNDLIQAGTGIDPTSAVGGYYAWFEILPANEQAITGCTGDANCVVNAGDTMLITIKQTAATRWLITIADHGHWSWQHSVTYKSARASAEWIVEAPSVLGAQTTLDNVGVVTFRGANSFTAGGKTKTIRQGNPDLVLLLNGLEATPSSVSRAGTAFNTCAYSGSCAAP